MGESHLERLAALRRELAHRGLAGFLVPHEDAYLGEYTRPDDARLEWLTGFDGSAGIAVVLQDRAAVLSDARYPLQIRRQAPDAFDVHDLLDLHWSDYLLRHVAPGERIGFDARLHSVRSAQRLTEAAQRGGFAAVPLPGNPIDTLWTERPLTLPRVAVPHPLEFAGEPASAKRRRLADAFGGRSALVVSAYDSVAWLLNLRGDDVPQIPVPLCRAVLHASGDAELFIDPAAVTAELVEHLGPGVAVYPAEALDGRLGRLGGDVLLDPDLTPVWIDTRLRQASASVVYAADPCLLAKAVKNETEIQGFRNAHRRDGAAFTSLLFWIEQTAPGGGVDEIAAARKLDELRGRQNLYRGQSFKTVSAVGPNAAHPHYNPVPETNLPLSPGQVFLIDSGAQFVDGTTDMTRTVPIGPPQPEHVRSYTLVVKAHLGHTMLRFPAGIGAMHIDAVARQHLWQAGWDYGHGTAHLVGSYLRVHEGPLYMHWARGNMIPVLPGMLLADEPAHYRAGRYGVRVENILLVTPPATPEEGDLPMAGFETISLAPIDRRLLDLDLLSREEIAWIDAYHARVARELAGLVEPYVAAWLLSVTRPLAAPARAADAAHQVTPVMASQSTAV